VAATVHPFPPTTTSAPPSAKRSSAPPPPSLTPQQQDRLNQLLARFLLLASRNALAANAALEMGDWVLRNLGA
jgi:hypothetical protein